MRDDSADLAGFERALGCSVLDPHRLYLETQTRSLEQCARELGLERILV
jgi:hypothetical protein